MGAGTWYLANYLGCVCIVVAISAFGFGVMWWGNRRTERLRAAKRKERRAAREAKALVGVDVRFDD